MKKERLLKKELRELKRIRTAIMVGEHNGDYDAVEERIEQIRAELGTAEDREAIFAMEPKSVQHLDTCYTLGDFHKVLEEYGSHYAVSRAWGVPNKVLENWVKKEEENEMAKLTIEQYKPLAEKGMKPKEIAETLGVKAQDVYNAKNEFKKAGLIEDTKKTTAPTAAQVKQVTEDVPVVTTVKPIQDFEKLFQEEKAKHDKLKEIVAEYQTSAKLSNEAVDQLKKERSQLKTDIKDLQEIANGYEQHGEELNEQLIAEREEIERLRERLKQQPQTKVEDATVIERLTSERDELERENDELAADYNMIKAKYERLKSFAKPIVAEFVESL